MYFNQLNVLYYCLNKDLQFTQHKRSYNLLLAQLVLELIKGNTSCKPLIISIQSRLYGYRGESYKVFHIGNANERS